MVLLVGLSNLQFVDMSSPRNIFVVGTSISIGQTLPNWLNSNISSINTGKGFFKNIIEFIHRLLTCTFQIMMTSELEIGEIVNLGHTHSGIVVL